MPRMSAGTWAIVALVAAVAATPTITHIDNIPLTEALAWAPGTAPPAGWSTALPIPTPLRPDYNRIIWRANVVPAASPAAGATAIYDDPDLNTVIIDGLNLNTATIQFSLATHQGQCGVGVAFGPVTVIATAFTGSSTRIAITVANPVTPSRWDQVSDLPYLCMNPGTGWINTNIMVGWTQPCLGDATGAVAGSATTDLCQNQAALVTPLAVAGQSSVENGDVNSPFYLERRGRIRCCGWRSELPAGALLAVQSLTRRYGVCINPNTTSCCGESTNVNSRILHSGGVGKPFDKFREKCCFKGNYPLTSADTGVTGGTMPATRTAGETPIISFLDSWCPCTIARVDDYCNMQLPIDGYTNLCCTDTKYSELNPTATAATKWGRCYDGIRTKCCNTGELYDPGTSQCCKVNGLQSVNTLCPCSDNTHCGLNQTCCSQWSPMPLEASLSDTTPSRSRCSPYVNYPAGTSSAAQPCGGQCIDKRFHICCNGNVCINGIEKCCNATCCNRFNQHCTPAGLRSVSNSRHNFREFRVGYDTCTSIEALTPDRGILAFLIPIVLLTAIFICYAISFFFARRVNALTPLTAYQKGIFAISSIIVLFMLPFIFAGTLYKYALLVMWGCFFTIIVSMSPYPLLYVIAALVHAVLLIYYIDPFYGNELLTLSHSKPLPHEFLTTSGVGFNGILHSISSIWNTRDATGGNVENGLRCTALYLFWFTRDPAVEDRVRWDNPAKPTYGYCSRDYGMILYIFGGLSIILMYFLFFLTLITHLRNVLISKADRLGGAVLDIDVPTGSIYN